MRTLVGRRALIGLGSALSCASALVAYVIVGTDAHPIGAAFAGGFVVLSLQVLAAQLNAGEP